MEFNEKKEIINGIFDEKVAAEEKLTVGTMELEVKTNIISKEKLRKVQKKTLKSIANALVNTYGPMGSNTLLLRGETKEGLVAHYSKDGHKVLKALSFNGVIEMSIWSELVSITKFTEKEVGDGTTSAVMLSNAVFQRLSNGNFKETPYEIIRSFKSTVAAIQENIRNNGREITIDDIYDICMISTNGNDEISTNISNIYEEFGINVFIDTKISNIEENQIITYDGLTVNEGYSDAAYINTKSGEAVINNPRIYAFKDPIDTIEMSQFFQKIIENNIITPNRESGEYIPTVILAPKISRDEASFIVDIVNFLHGFDKMGDTTNKPPLLIITNLGVNLDNYHDIATLCNCKVISKYVDPKMQAIDVAKGLAPTLDNITEFYGKCESVVANIERSKFINPEGMFVYEDEKDGAVIIEEDGVTKRRFIAKDEDDNFVYSPIFKSLVNALTAELDNAISQQDDLNVIGNIRKRLQSLKANMVEFQVGGITISDRDNLKDLVEDAVKNCKSAATNGIGYAANFEGFNAALKTLDQFEVDSIDYKICSIILESYLDIIKILYSSIISDENKVKELIIKSLEEGSPYNLSTMKFDHKVLSSIEGDIKILDAISKIMTMMITSNQALVQNASINTYE